MEGAVWHKDWDIMGWTVCDPVLIQFSAPLSSNHHPEVCVFNFSALLENNSVTYAYLFSKQFNNFLLVLIFLSKLIT